MATVGRKPPYNGVKGADDKTWRAQHNPISFFAVRECTSRHLR